MIILKKLQQKQLKNNENLKKIIIYVYVCT